MKKYQGGIRAHKKINLLDNDSSSEEDDSIRLSVQQAAKLTNNKKVKDYKVQQKPMKER